MELDACLVDAVAVLRVDDEDEALGARVVVSPQRSDLVLPADILCVCAGASVWRPSLRLRDREGRGERTQTLNLREGRERCQCVLVANLHRAGSLEGSSISRENGEGRT